MTKPNMTTTLLPIIFPLLLISSLTSITASPEDDFLDAHNACACAHRRYHDCKLQHSSGSYGENLAEGRGQLTAGDAVGLWVGEKSCYDYESNACVGGECLHYTQVVWNETVRVGCGSVPCRNGWVFVICSYDPPGNYVGRRPY